MAWFWFADIRRKRSVRLAEVEFDNSKLENEELTIRGCTTLQDNENMNLKDEIHNRGKEER